MSTSSTARPPGDMADRTGSPNVLAGLMAQGRLKLLPMIIVLIAVWVVLELVTGGLFLSARNLTNLSGQVAITAILASGAVIVMTPATSISR
jgi:D-xylose transport system permease protein